MRVFLSAGEASGDAYAAALVREMRSHAQDADLRFEGIGGRRSREAGVSLAADSSTWGVIGIAQALKVFPRCWAGLRDAKRALSGGEPGLFVPIDFGFFNCKLARFAKGKGWKVLYFIPPGSWRRDRQGQDLPKICDEIVTPFYWSCDLLRKMGAKAHCFGHPARQLVKEREEELIKAGQEDRLNVAVLPGSRASELDLLLPVIAEALKDESRTAEFAVAPNFSAEALKAKWLKLRPERTRDLFTENDTYGVLYRARAAIVCSGTATLEAALCVCPHIVLYRVSPGVALQAKLAGLKFEFISQPNILLGKAAVPELIQENATAANVRKHLDKLLTEGDERRQQIWSFMELDKFLGPTDAITHTACVALGMLGIAVAEPETSKQGIESQVKA